MILDIRKTNKDVKSFKKLTEKQMALNSDGGKDSHRRLLSHDLRRSTIYTNHQQINIPEYNIEPGHKMIFVGTLKDATPEERRHIFVCPVSLPGSNPFKVFRFELSTLELSMLRAYCGDDEAPLGDSGRYVFD